MIYNKRGQFYIIAAIFIIIIISSLASVSTYINFKSKSRTVNDLGNELNEESSRIIDYGIYSNQNLSSLEYNFTEYDFTNYFLYKTSGANITFIYGNKSDLRGVQYYRDNTGKVSLLRANFKATDISSKNLPVEVSDVDGTVKVTLLNKEFSFKLRENEMFYFVITKEENGEVFVESNQDK